MTKRYIDNDLHSSMMRFKVNKKNDLNDIIRDLFDASDSDWVLHDNNHVTLIFPTVHYTSHGWDNVDGSQAKSSDLGGYTLNMIDRLADKTDIVDMWYPKDGHVGIHFYKDAMARRLDSDLLNDFNRRNGFVDYRPSDYRTFDDWAADMNDVVIF